jgi:hypothetical protein
VEDSSEHDTEPLGSVRCWKVLSISRLAATQEGVISMKLVINLYCIDPILSPKLYVENRRLNHGCN